LKDVKAGKMEKNRRRKTLNRKDFGTSKRAMSAIKIMAGNIDCRGVRYYN